MVSKLKFKGDKPAKRKNKEDPERSEKRAKATPTNPEDIEGWSTASTPNDLYGPLLIVLADDGAPICMCADSNGQVYTSSELETVSSESDQKHLTLVEPSSVQQVFVLVPMQASDNTYALKSAHGKYLSVDEDEVVQAKSTAIGPSEIFTLIKSQESNGWLIQTSWNKYLSIKKVKDGYAVRGNSSDFGFCETFTLRVQTRYTDKVRNSKKSETDNNDKISTKDLEGRAKRKLDKDEVKILKRAFKEGHLNEELLNLRQKSKSDTRC